MPTCFIHNLPKDQLLAVFQHYLFDDGGDDYRTEHTQYKPALTSNLSSSASPMTLFAVCKQWRSFYAEPSLWASLAVYKPRMEQVPMIISWLQRSAMNGPPETVRTSTNIPLDLISLYLHAPSGDTGWDRQAIEFILDVFLFNAGRLKHLTIKVTDDFWGTYLSDLTAPYLQSMEFDLSHQMLTFIRSIYDRNPSVRKISWRPILIRHPLPTSIPWNLLTHVKLPLINQEHFVLRDLLIALIYCENLVSLEVAIALPFVDECLFIMDDISEGQAESLDRLRICRELEEYDQDIDNVLQSRIHLSRLRHLKVEAMRHDATSFLRHIAAPSLCSLEVIQYPRDQRSDFFKGIFFFLAYSRPPLTYLSLYDPEIPELEILELLNGLSLPELQHLEVHVSNLGENAMRALTVKNKDPEVHVSNLGENAMRTLTDKDKENSLPNLRKLVLSRCSTSNGKVADMVLSRLPTLVELSIHYHPLSTCPDPETRRIRLQRQDEEFLWLKSLTSDLEEGQLILTVDSI